MLITYSVFAILVVALLISTVKLPVHAAGWIVSFDVNELLYIPFDVENRYSEISGFDRVKLVYENSDESLTYWATTEIGWNNVSSWDETLTLNNGTTAYYTSTDETQMISWRTGDVEYAIDYTSTKPIAKSELIKVASKAVE
ncbi:hypothetical protein [Pseudalkalibacillus berkeleyi]|uniref:DUF4367 domain-containing protein n=1 Tax=Pseudalkalibacillus berkeleyi TaxID=1069813 RepID=A0ABS9H6J8_9BACL|nr:hypothetical protein [Pseudalkalibacillus berkeleyi]MCF6139536.1 hypothetical protein [Pseudalkalibacillus berkeleyi]